MSDGRELIRHKISCNGPRIVVGPARVTCASCHRYAARTDVPPGICNNCRGKCRPDRAICAKCADKEIPSPERATEDPTHTPPRYLGPVCRGCYQPATIRVKPGRGFVCPTCTRRAA